MPVSIITNDRPPELFKSFVSDELSNFTVIVGLNGAGKSRLLQAIANTELTLTESQIVGNSNDPLHSIEFLDQSSFSAANFSKTEFEFGTNDKVFHDWRHETANEIVKLTKTETAGHESPTTSLAKTLINGEPRWNPNANALAKAMSSMNATPPKSSGANHNWNQCVRKKHAQNTLWRRYRSREGVFPQRKPHFDQANELSGGPEKISRCYYHSGIS